MINTNVSSRRGNDENRKNVENESTIKNSHIVHNKNDILATENNIERNTDNISIKYENDGWLQLNNFRTELESESNSEQSTSISHELIPHDYIPENNNITNDFKSSLATWATEHKISHISLRALLQILKQHAYFSNLPIDARSLLHTPRQSEIRVVTPGLYHHFGLLKSVLHVLTSVKNNNNCIKITINIDGLPLSKSSSQQLWPILGSILPYDNIFMIGLYHGNEKPANVNDFLKDFVEEAKEMCENGINVNGRNIQCRLEALICDTPAKAFVLCVKGHAGYSSCKCQIEGEYVGRRVCFPQINAPPRTDDDSIRKIDEIIFTNQISLVVWCKFLTSSLLVTFHLIICT